MYEVVSLKDFQQGFNHDLICFKKSGLTAIWEMDWRVVSSSGSWGLLTQRLHARGEETDRGGQNDGGGLEV